MSFCTCQIRPFLTSADCKSDLPLPLVSRHVDDFPAGRNLDIGRFGLTGSAFLIQMVFFSTTSAWLALCRSPGRREIPAVNTSHVEETLERRVRFPPSLQTMMRCCPTSKPLRRSRLTSNQLLERVCQVRSLAELRLVSRSMRQSTREVLTISHLFNVLARCCYCDSVSSSTGRHPCRPPPTRAYNAEA